MRQIESGFTLIELLVTVAIVGILAATGIAQYQAYREKAYNSVAITQAHNALVAIQAYLIDRDDSGPANWSVALAVTVRGVVTGGTLATILPGFTHERGVRLSVSANKSRTSAVVMHCKGTRSTVGSYRNLVQAYGLSSTSTLYYENPGPYSIAYGGSSC